MADQLIFDLPNVVTPQTVDCYGTTLVSGSMSVNSSGNCSINFLNLTMGTMVIFTFVNTSGVGVTLRVSASNYSCRGVVGIGTPVDLTATGVTVSNNQGMVALGNTCTINGVPYLVFNA